MYAEAYQLQVASKQEVCERLQTLLAKREAEVRPTLMSFAYPCSKRWHSKRLFLGLVQLVFFQAVEDCWCWLATQVLAH